MVSSWSILPKYNTVLAKDLWYMCCTFNLINKLIIKVHKSRNTMILSNSFYEEYFHTDNTHITNKFLWRKRHAWEDFLFFIFFKLTYFLFSFKFYPTEPKSIIILLQFFFFYISEVGLELLIIILGVTNTRHHIYQFKDF